MPKVKYQCLPSNDILGFEYLVSGMLCLVLYLTLPTLSIFTLLFSNLTLWAFVGNAILLYFLPLNLGLFEIPLKYDWKALSKSNVVVCNDVLEICFNHL